MAAIERHYPDDPGLMADLLAITSAGMSVVANCKLAKKAYAQARNGGTRRESFMRSHYAALSHYMLTGEIRGRKTGSFAECLRNPESTRVPVDLWMMRWAGIVDRKSPTKRQYDEIEERVVREARACGMSPRDYQAKVWSETRGNGGSFANELAQLELL